MACWGACQGSRIREDALNTIVEISGRKALPVRAIPLLTDWRGLTPDEVAQILAGDSDYWPSFDGLSAHRLQPDGSTESIPPRWWASWVVRKLQAISDTIKARQITHETGVQQWRSESLVQLPAGVFVWLDEFQAAHTNEYGPEGMRARGNPTGFDPSAHALNFNPHPDPNVAPPRLVLEGFGSNADTGNKKSTRADDGEEWKEQARQRAREIIARQKAKDLYPSQEDIADEIAREFRAGGKPLTGAYIKRHALKGISSATSRKFSTQILKGK